MTTRRRLLGGALAVALVGARAQAPARQPELVQRKVDLIIEAGTFERSTKRRLVLNLKAAKAMGIVVPAALRLQADEVIE